MKKKSTRKVEAINKFATVAPIAGMVKNNARGVVSGVYKTAGADTTTSPTSFYSPELTPDSWLLPKSRQELLKWVRIFYNLDPYIHAIINMHAMYPVCNFHLQYKDKEMADLFERKLFDNPEFDWLDFQIQFWTSYWKFGETFVWGDWNASRSTWKGFTFLDPSLVEYKEDAFSGKTTIELIPTIDIQKMVRDALMQGRSDLPAVIIESILSNQQIPLDAEGTDPNYLTGERYSPPKVSAFFRKTDPGSQRGTPVIQSLFKDMILKDKLRLAQLATADRHHLPIELWTVGQWSGDKNTSAMPTEADLQNMRDMITQATQQPPFSIVYGPLLKYEALGVAGKLLSIYDDLGYVENQILVGLGVNKSLILSEGVTFGSAKSVSLNRLLKQYKVLRNLFVNWMKKYVLLPIARANDWKDEYGNWIIPDIIFEESLNPEQDKELFDVLFKMWDKGIVSTQTLFNHCITKLDYDEEQKRLLSEIGTIFQKGPQDKRLGMSGATTPAGAGSTDKPAGPTGGPNFPSPDKDKGDAGPDDDNSYLSPPSEGAPGGESDTIPATLPEPSTPQ